MDEIASHVEALVKAEAWFSFHNELLQSATQPEPAPVTLPPQPVGDLAGGVPDTISKSRRDSMLSTMTEETDGKLRQDTWA